MAERNLSEDSITAGKTLLDRLDEFGLRPETAGWIFVHSLNEWRYCIASASVDAVGRRKLYSGVIAVLDICNFGDALAEADVHLVSPNEDWYLLMREATSFNQGLRRIAESYGANGMRFDALIYRTFSSPPDNNTLRKNSEKFVTCAREAFCSMQD